MADANWLKKAPPATSENNDDPFAELTRIMGFDPRVPFRSPQSTATLEPVTAHQVEAPKVDVSDDDLDFSIDLEQELMGALEPELSAMSQPSHVALDDGRASAAVSFQREQAPAVLAEEEPPLDEQAYGDVASVDYSGTYATPDQAAYPAENERGSDEQDEPTYMDYAANVGSDDSAPSGVADEAAYEAPAYEEARGSYAAEAHGFAQDGYGDESDVARDHPDQSYADVQGYVDEFDHGAALAADLDDALVASFEDALEDDDREWMSEPEADAVAATEQEAPAAQYVASPRADEFAGAFDAAMAEVDMDFTASSAPAVSFEENETTSFEADEATLEADDAASFEEAHAAPGDVTPTDFEDDLESLLAGGLHAEAAQWSDGDDAAARVAGEDTPEETQWDEAISHDADETADAGFEAGHVAVYAAEAEDYRTQAPEGSREEELQAGTEDGPEQDDINDAIAELAAVVRGYDRPQQPQAAPQSYQPVEQLPVEVEEVPDIETIDVPENAVALADDLDIPEVQYAEDDVPSFDHLDAELAAAFGEPAIETIQAAQPEPEAAPAFDLESGYDADEGRAAAFAAAPYAVAGAGAAAAHFAQRSKASDFEVRRDASQAQGYDTGVRDFEVDPDFEDDAAMAGELAAVRRPSPRRGLIIASIVGGIAVIGAVGAFALSGGSGGSGEPALVKADAEPVKVKPENPGGTAVPNQQSGVFDRAAGAPASQPNQEALISTEEEPVDMAERFPEAAPQLIDESADIEDLAGDVTKDADRIEQAIAADNEQPVEEVAAVAPRKVRTMVVKPDGTLVPREDVAPEPDSVGSTTAAGSLTAPTISGTAEQGLDAGARDAAAGPDTAAAATSGANTPAAAQPVAAEETAAVANPPAQPRASIPERVPVAPSRPADQPLDIVGEVKADQVAALTTEAPAAGSWAVQIASQPSEAAARSSYQDLSRRYSSVLGDRNAHIVKAEIAGKGTFWRVRVPAGSRNEAIKLCESYKAAGGNCFVSK
ncbi:SPOR domain-containing protein [Arvimicrobium flavum]|uniref:SPOR domain-containing protein n=1 Tax=Arvimicrobium flavum TaxID=3393320 RepID=UPI00237A127D|nr:SPOR domain-containing protein [Mesorhizobium shangrilense]